MNGHNFSKNSIRLIPMVKETKPAGEGNFILVVVVVVGG